MGKIYSALGLMSGTSMDGVDASIIQSDGETYCKTVYDKFFEYNKGLFENLTNLRDKINHSKDIISLSDEIEAFDKEITFFHAQLSNKIIVETGIEIDLIGFHGQTIFHNVKEKISKQLGNANLLSQLTLKSVVYNFRQNDLNNGGEGAPLTTIYHKQLVESLEKQKKIKTPVSILNIGGIANITSIDEDFKMSSMDIGPGNCLIDKWIRTNSEIKYDNNGDIAKSGKIDKFILEQSLDSFYNKSVSKKKSLDLHDFDISFATRISFENGTSTITEYTADILSKKIFDNDTYISGGGRKNKFLIESIQKKVKKKIKNIDDLGIDGDFIESQAFGYLAIRSFLNLPISFPETTGCKNQSTGGVLVKNY